jgi:DNA mismatch endonuclease, patch repair protein
VGGPATSSAAASARMRANPRRDTEPELPLRRELHRRGRRFRVDQAVVPGTSRRADIVFPRARVAVFVDGCFRHGCPDHSTAELSRSNNVFWSDKVATNVRRDVNTDGICTLIYPEPNPA